MIVYKKISSYTQSEIDLTFSSSNTEEVFTVCGGLAETGVGSTGLVTAGFCFSGYDGYLFDQSGNFFGGYQPNKPFSLQVHLKTGNTLSYFQNGQLIANNLHVEENVEYIKLEKENMSSTATVYGQPHEKFTLPFLMLSGGAISLSGELVAQS